MPVYAVVILSVAYLILTIVSNRAAYSNGVTDGYGYARERNNPSYQHAGRMLRKTMAHRWRELRKDDEDDDMFRS